MASDEKTGFVIGLLFISVVAWALNGIPRFDETEDSNELTAVMISRPVGIRPKLQKVFSPKPAQEEPVPEASPLKQDDNMRRTPPDETYIVQDGDTLWRIAAQQLGEGHRYKEIAELNAGLLKDENTLTVGTRLTMPPR